MFFILLWWLSFMTCLCNALTIFYRIGFRWLPIRAVLCDRYCTTLVLRHRLQEHSHPPSLLWCLCLHLPWLEQLSSPAHPSLFSSQARWNKRFCVWLVSLSYSGYTRGKFRAYPFTLQNPRQLVLWKKSGRGGGLVVSALACSDNPSSIHAGC